MATTVRAPDGRRWAIRRRWLPRLGTDTLWGRFHRRHRQTMRRASDVADADPAGCLDLFGEGIAAAVVIILTLLVVVFVIFPLAVAIVDVVVLLLLLVLGLVARVVFRRPWLVEARAEDGTRLQWRVVGWRASRRRIEEIGRLLGAGITPPGALLVEGPPTSD